MDARAQELLDSIENIELKMIHYIKNNASRLSERILVYETSRDSFVPFDRRFYLNPDSMIELETCSSLDADYKKIGEVTVDKFVEEYKQKAMKLALRKLGEELEKIPSEAK